MAATRKFAEGWDRIFGFQSPIHRVNGCNAADAQAAWNAIMRFSPLFIGSMAATS